SRGIESRVQGISLAAIVLVENQQLGIAPRPIIGANSLGWDTDRKGRWDFVEIIGFHESLDRRIGGPVADQNDLVPRVLEREKGQDARRDGDFFVVRGNEHREWWQRVRSQQTAHMLIVRQMPMQ